MPKSHGHEIASCWDAGETGCGQLIVGLKNRLGQLQAEQLLEVTARDAGAPRDLPAWCRITGNELVYAAHPVYVLRKPAKPFRI